LSRNARDVCENRLKREADPFECTESDEFIAGACIDEKLTRRKFRSVENSGNSNP